MTRRLAVLAVVAALLVTGIVLWPRHHRRVGTSASPAASSGAPTGGYPGMPPVVDASNVYSEIGPQHLSPGHRGDPARVYVPNGKSNTVSVIDPTTRAVIANFRTGAEPQHIVPSYDLSTLWVLDNRGNTLIPIDPATGTPGLPVSVDDPYNLYFTPDGSSAIVVAEAHGRLDFRDPHTMALTSSLAVPGCNGMNHADYNPDGAYLLITCEYAGKIAKVDVLHHQVLGLLDLTKSPVAG